MNKNKKIKRLKKQIRNMERNLEYQGRSADSAWKYSYKQTQAIKKMFKALRLIAEASKYQI